MSPTIQYSLGWKIRSKIRKGEIKTGVNKGIFSSFQPLVRIGGGSGGGGVGQFHIVQAQL